MKQFYLLVKLFLLLSVQASWAQVLNPNDPVVVYNPAAPPTEPAYGQIGKWVKTTRVSWNTDSYKAYIYKGMQFRLKWPANYDPTKKYPMMIFFHGLGEKGSKYDNEYSLYHGGQTHMNKVNNGSFDGFIFVPQNTSGYFGPSYFNGIEELINNFFTPQLNIDPYRITVEGLSAGGTATWDFMQAKPKLVAALGPISAANPNLVNTLNTWKFTPIWWFQGGSDPNPRPAVAQGVTTTALNAGANLKLTIYPGQGHGVWNLAWGEADFFPFAMRAYKSNPWPLFGRTEFCPDDPVNVILGLTPGFNQYQWRKDGQVISGATSNTFTATSFGTYDARIYNGTSWSEWSPAPVVIKLKAPTISPDIAISGMMSNVLPTPAGVDSVVLEVPATYTSYQWKKTTDAAILSTTNKVAVYQAGEYAVKVTEQFGCSSDFSAPFKVIPANGTNGPDALTSIIATTTGRTSIVLNWTDKPNPTYNESLFEIYRSVNAETGYSLVAKVNADIKTYSDNNLAAGTSYFYKVRPVNNNGAAAASAPVTATTLADVTPPTAPADLKVTGTSRNSVALSWLAATDDVGVDKYEIYINNIRSYTINGNQTTFLVTGLNYRQSYTFMVKAKDATGNLSIASNQASAATVNSGLNYKYYTYTGTWSNLPDFNTLTPVKTGNSPTADISVRTQNDRFGLLWEGFINIPVSGNYTFETYSDDGSKLYLGNYSHTATALVNNDGAHGNQYKEGTIYLSAGSYPIAITYFEATGGENMQVFWKNTAHGVTARQQIPASFFSDTITLPAKPVAPTNINVQPVSHNKLNVTWADNSNNETGFEIYRSATSNGVYSIVKTVGANVINYTDTALAPQTTYYYRVKAINAYGDSGFALSEYDGLKYDYYEAANYTSLPDFNSLTPIKSGNVATVDITPRSRNEQFAMKFEGWIYLPTAGNYTFYTTSDAGSKLYVDGFTESNMIVSNDHLSGSVEKSGVRNLTAGYHKLIVTYFEATGSRSLSARYAGPGISKRLITADMLLNPYIKGTTLPAPQPPATPSSLTGTALSSSQIELKWNDNSTTELENEIYRATAENSNYTLLKSLPANDSARIVFIDTMAVANTTYFYKVSAKNEGGSSSYSNEISVVSGNNAPLIANIPGKGMRFGTQLQIDVAASDEDGDLLTLAAPNLPSFGVFIDNGNGTGKFTFTPSITDLGAFNITLTVNDGHGGNDSETFIINVDDNYQPVLAAIADVTIAENTTNSIILSETDENLNDTTIWTITGLPAFATVNTDGRQATIDLAPGYADNGSYPITVTVNDGKGGEDIKSFTLTVTDIDPNYSVYINFTDGAYQASAPWYNTNKKPALGDIFGDIKDNLNRNTAMTMQIMTPWQNINGGANTNNGGYKSGNNSGVYPDNVTVSNWWTQNVKQTIKLAGLDTSYAYDFTFFGSRNGISDDRIALYRLNDTATGTNNAKNNQNVMVTISNISPNAAGEIMLDIDLAPGSSYAYISSMVIKASYNDKKAPSAVGTLHANIIPEGARLSWTDRAFNETAYKIHRSTSKPGPYQVIGNLNANDTAFTDPNIVASTTYFYIVEAVNPYGVNFSDTVSVTVPNRAPSLSEIANVNMKTDSVLVLQLSATDDPADIISFTATGLPAFAILNDNGDGTGNMTLNPTSGHPGTYNVTVTASDNQGLQSSRSFTILITDKNISSIYVNFNRLNAAGASWNNFNTAPNANVSLVNLKDATGSNTGVSITLLDKLSGDNTNGQITGNNTGIYPDVVMATYWYDQTNSNKRLRISGLANTKKYNLIFFGSREGVTDNRNTIYSVGTQSVTLNAASNTTNTVQLNGLSADANGNIEFTIRQLSGSFAAYLGAVVIESYVESNVPFAPDNLQASGISQSTINLKWIDKSSNETGFEVYRATSRNGDYSMITTTAANTTSYIDNGLAANTLYFYKVRAKADTSFSAYTEVASGGTLSYQVYFNFNTVNPAPAPWNNTNALPYEGQTMVNPLDAQGNPTSFSWTMIKNFTGTNPAGVQTGNNSGVYPDKVMAESYYVEPGDTGKIKFTGLDQSKEYSFTFFASRNGGGDRIGAYEINGRVVTLNANTNSTNTVTLDKLSPDENGELLLKVYINSQYGYLNAMVIAAYPKEVVTAPNLVARSGNLEPVLELNDDKAFVKDDNTVKPDGPVITDEKVFPNPFSSYFNLSMQLAKSGKVVLNLYNMSGSLLMVRDLGTLSTGFYQQRIIVNNNSVSGLYILQILVDGKPEKAVKLIRN